VTKKQQQKQLAAITAATTEHSTVTAMASFLANYFLALLGTYARLKQNNISYWRLHHQPPAAPVRSTKDPCHGCSFISLIVYWWHTGRVQMLDASMTCPLGELLWDFVSSMWWWHPSRMTKHDPSMPILWCFVPKYWPPCWAFENVHKHKKVIHAIGITTGMTSHCAVDHHVTYGRIHQVCVICFHYKAASKESTGTISFSLLVS